MTSKVEQLELDVEYLRAQVPHKGATGVFATAAAISKLLRAAAKAPGDTHSRVHARDRSQGSNKRRRSRSS